MADNNEAQQPPENGVPQQCNERVARNQRNTSSQVTYTRTNRDFVGATLEIGGVLTLPE